VKPVEPAPPKKRPLLDRRKLLPLLQRLARPGLNAGQRARAVLAAGASRDPFLLGPLKRLSRDHDPSVREAVAKALGQLHDLRAVPLLIRIASRERAAAVRRAAVESLGLYPLPRVRRFLTTVAVGSTMARTTRLVAVAALQRHRTVEAQKTLATLKTTDGAVAGAAARAASGMRLDGCIDTCSEPRFLLALRDLLSTLKGRARARAVVVLAKTGTQQQVLPVLLFAARDRDGRVRRAGLRALARHPSPRAEEHLLKILEGDDLNPSTRTERRLVLMLVKDRKGEAVRRALLHLLRTPSALQYEVLQILASRPGKDITAVIHTLAGKANVASLRVAALRALVSRKTKGLVPLLWANRTDPAPRVRMAALELLRKHYPKDLIRLLAKQPRPLDRKGFAALLIVGAGLGTGGLYAISHGAQGEYPVVAALSGAALGTATAFLLSYKGEITLDQTGIFSTMGIWGTMAGLSGGLGARLGDHAAWVVLSGEVIGVAAGMLLMKRAGWDKGDLAYINATTAQALVAGGGIVTLAYEDRDYSVGERVGMGLAMGLFPVAALTASSLTTHRVSFSSQDKALVAYTSVLGTYLGGLTLGMASKDPETRHVAGAMLLGEGLGYMAGIMVSQYTELPMAGQGWLWMSTCAGSAMGGGIGLLSRELRGRTAFGLAGVGAGVGISIGALAARRLSLRSRDLPLSTLGAGYGTWFGAWLPTLFFGSDPEADKVAAGGGALLGGFTGLLAGNVVSRLADVSDHTTKVLTVTSASSISLGAGLGLMIPGSSSRAVVGLMHGASALGLTAGALVGRRWKFSSADMGLVATLAGYGSFSAAFLPVLWNDNNAPGREVGGGLLLGLGLGTLTGMAVAQYSDLDGDDVGELAAWASGGLAMGGGLGLLADHDGKTTVGLLEGVGAAGVVAGSLLASRFKYSSRDRLLMTHTALAGALQGTFLADLWQEDPPGDVRFGGTLVGASTGLVVGAIVAQRAEVESGDVLETTLALGAGDTLGLGIALLAGAGQSNTLRVMQAVGTMAWVVGGLRAPKTTYTSGDIGLVSLCATYGAFLGGWIPAFKSPDLGDPETSEVIGGMAAGVGAGLMAGSFLSQRTNLKNHEVSEVSFIAAGSTLFGAGLGLMLPTEDDRVVVGLMQGLGLAGTIAGAFVTDRTTYNDTDYFLTTGAMALGAWQGVGASLLADAPNRRLAGAIMAAAGLGGFAGALVSQYIDMSHLKLWTFFSGAVWGSWIGVWAGNLARDKGVDLTPGQVAGITMLASDVGLILTGLALSPVLDVPPERLGWINLFGLGGMALSTGIGAAFSADGAQIGTLAGSVVGLGTGIVVTHFMSFSSGSGGPSRRPPRKRAGTRRPSMRGARLGLPSGLPPLVADWAPNVMLQPDIDPATGENRGGGTRFVVGITGRLH